MNILRGVWDHRRRDSLAARSRRERFALFMRLISSLEPPFSILDVGGTPLFWKEMGFAEECEASITLLNIKEPKHSHRNLKSVIGDARDMRKYADGGFDVVFSNSVIEHVGGYEEQRRMAREMRRVGKRYFLQTPNRLFPIEPHFVFPFFQFLPLSVKVFLLRHLNLGWHKRTPDKERAAEVAGSIRLLNEREVRELFPEGTVYKDKFLGLTKSFVVYGGQD